MVVPWYVLLIVVGVGIVQIAVGVAIGRLLPVIPSSKPLAGRMTRHEAKRELEGVSELTHKLYNMMADLSNDVGRQRIRVEQLTKEFNAVAEERTGDSKFKKATRSMLGELQSVIERMAQRISDVETELRDRASEVDQRLGEFDADPLLGLPSRAFLEASMAERIDDCRRRGTPFSLGSVDMDQLGETNARFGTAAGDRLLRTAVDAIKQAIGRTATIARMGDDEIGILFPNCDLHSAAEKLTAARLRASESTLGVPSGTLRPLFSFGVAQYAPREKASTLVARCDKALAAAKQAGRDRGYLHDGKECTPVVPPEDETTLEPTAAGDMDSCFAEIRARLKEVTASE